VTDLHPLAALLRRYAFGYTAAHDFAVCRELMVEDYVLRMGEHEVRGRDTAYVPATEKQYRQYPGLGFTVHELVLGEDRAALHFTEHGRSVLHGGEAAWSGISLYRWDGERLVECRVEQDYAGRRAQQRSGRAHAIEAPGIDPWTVEPGAADPGTEAVVRGWLGSGGLGRSADGSLDDEHSAAVDRVRLEDATTTVLDLFTAGDRAAFHAVVEGRGASLYSTGLVTVAGGEVVAVRAITDRLASSRRSSAISGT
jgi:hypothetical protein